MPFFEQPEGATPIDDISELKIENINTLNELNKAEMRNILCALRKHLMSRVEHPHKWFNFSNLISIHKDMFSDVWEWAGQFRRTQTSIGIQSYLISTELKKLCDDAKFWYTGNSLSLLEQAARIHHRLVWIHPFPNGNGRFARLVSDMYLKGCRGKHPNWPTNLQENAVERKKYISTLKAADEGNFEPLIAYLNFYGASGGR